MICLSTEMTEENNLKKKNDTLKGRTPQRKGEINAIINHSSACYC